MNDFDLTTEDGVVALMRQSKSEIEWNSNCDKVKEANGNKYPGFWYLWIIVSGLAYEVQDSWKNN